MGFGGPLDWLCLVGAVPTAMEKPKVTPDEKRYRALRWIAVNGESTDPQIEAIVDALPDVLDDRVDVVTNAIIDAAFDAVVAHLEAHGVDLTVTA